MYLCNLVCFYLLLYCSVFIIHLLPVCEPNCSSGRLKLCSTLYSTEKEKTLVLITPLMCHDAQTQHTNTKLSYKFVVSEWCKKSESHTSISICSQTLNPDTCCFLAFDLHLLPLWFLAQNTVMSLIIFYENTAFEMMCVTFHRANSF